jgi:uncharacterized RDD family membrane protein YckC
VSNPSPKDAGANPFREWKHGSRWRRFVAFMIDTTFVTLLILPLASVARAAFGGEANAGAAAQLIGILAFFVYFAGLESSPYQATVGKQAMGLKVTDLQGRRIGFMRGLARGFTKLFTCGCFLSAGLLFYPMLLSKYESDRQVMHDNLAGTLVLDARPTPSDGVVFPDVRGQVSPGDTKQATESIVPSNPPDKG